MKTLVSGVRYWRDPPHIEATMKKLRLDLERLRVDSFELAEEPPARGTVRGHLRYTDPRACPFTGNWYCSVGDTCSDPNYTCGDTDCVAQP